MTQDALQSSGRWRARLAQGLPFLTLLVYVAVATVGTFSGGLWGGVGIGCGLALYLGTAWLERRWPRPSREVLGLALIALAVTVALNLHSTNPPLSWFDWTRLVTIWLPLALLTSPEVQARADHKHLFTVLALAAFAGAFALGIELVLDAPVLRMVKGVHAALTQYNRGLSYLVVLALPIMAALWVRPLAATGSASLRAAGRIAPFAVFVAVMLFPASLTESRASKLALIAALAVVAAAHVAPKFTRRGLGVLVFLLLGWPFAVQKCFLAFRDRLSHLPDSWRARMEIWDYLSYRIAERPGLGWGLGTSRTLDFKNPHGDMYTLVTEAAPHPHNVVTQLWVELGAPGLALGVVFALLLLRQAGRLSPPLVPFALGAWMAALCLSCVAYNFWTDSMFATFALAALAFALLDRRMKKAALQAPSLTFR